MKASIGTVGQLVGAIRAQLAAPTRDTLVRRRPPGRLEAAAGITDYRMGALITARTAHIAMDDPQRGRKAFRVFLEGVLLAELGQNLMSDPKFYQMLDDVQAALDSQPGAAELVRHATAYLLSQIDGTATKSAHLHGFGSK